MKHLTIFLLCLFVLPVYAQKSYRQVLNKDLSLKSKSINELSKVADAKISNSLFKSISRFTWDQDKKEWDAANSSEVKYTSNGDIEEVIDYDIDGKPTLKTSYYKLDNGKITGNIQCVFADGVWINSRKTELEFDEFNKEIRNEYYRWQGTKWELTSGHKVLVESKTDNEEITVSYIFDETDLAYEPYRRTISTKSNKLIEQSIFQEYIENTWVNISAEGYDYDFQQKVSSVYYLVWDGERFENKELYTNILWYDYSAEKYSEMELKEWDGTKWCNKQKAVYQYGLNKSVIGITMDFIDNTWQYSFRISEEYDFQNNPKSIKVEGFMANDWKVLVESRNEYTYDQQSRLIESITKIFNGYEWMNVSKENIYYNQKSTGFSVEKLAVKIFPNPSANYFMIETNSVSEAEINIYNLASALVKNIESANLKEERIEVSDLQKGMYIVEIVQGNQIYTSKLLVN
jgi:Secretion system C-terminal sorting domain